MFYYGHRILIFHYIGKKGCIGKELYWMLKKGENQFKFNSPPPPRDYEITYFRSYIS